MTVTVQDVMRRVRNYFVSGAVTREWLTRGGTLYPRDIIAPGTWIAVPTGSPAPGVYQLDENGVIPGFPDRQWTGTIHTLAPTGEFLQLCSEIAAWAARNPDPTLTAEKFGEYSCSRASAAWERVFAAALTPYMRMFPEVEV